jgi:hypothetical protein
MLMQYTSGTGKMCMSLIPPESKYPTHFFWVFLIICTIIALWFVPEIAAIYPGKGSGSGLLGYASIIALVVTISAPLVYGWYSRDRTGALLIGTLPFLMVSGLIRIVAGNGTIGPGYPIYSVVYVAVLVLLGGLEGFFAAKKTTGYLVIALLLAVLWAGIFFSGIH